MNHLMTMMIMAINDWKRMAKMVNFGRAKGTHSLYIDHKEHN